MIALRSSLTVVGLAVALAACGSSATTPPSRPAPEALTASAQRSAASPSAPPSGLSHIKLALTSKSTGGLYLFVGKDLGIYQRYGIDPEIVIGDSGILVTGLASGDIDFLGTTPSAIQGAEKDLPIRVIYTARTTRSICSSVTRASPR